MEKIKSFFELIDRFDIPISFRYQKDDSYSTPISGFFSFVIIVLSVISSIYFFIPFVQKKIILLVITLPILTKQKK